MALWGAGDHLEIEEARARGECLFFPASRLNLTCRRHFAAQMVQKAVLSVRVDQILAGFSSFLASL